ncbi:hypothetical protein LH399_04365 [Fusobacterium nucleatum]
MTFIKNSMLEGKYKCRCGYRVKADENLNLPIKKCPNCGSENINDFVMQPLEGDIKQNYFDFYKSYYVIHARERNNQGNEIYIVSSSSFIEGTIASNYTNFEKIKSYGPFKFPFINQLVDYFKKDNEVYKNNPRRIAY